MRLQIQLLPSIYRSADSIKHIVNDLCKTIAYSNISNYGEVAHALQMCKDSFSKKIMLYLTLSLGVEIDSVKFNITYYQLAWCNGSTVVF